MGARVALQAQFPNLTFILDRPHPGQHLYEGAEAIGLTGLERHHWVSDKLHLIDTGDVRQVIRTLDLLQKSVLKSGKRDGVETSLTYKKVKKLKAEDFKCTRAGAFRNIQSNGGNS